MENSPNKTKRQKSSKGSKTTKTTGKVSNTAFMDPKGPTMLPLSGVALHHRAEGGNKCLTAQTKQTWKLNMR